MHLEHVDFSGGGDVTVLHLYVPAASRRHVFVPAPILSHISWKDIYERRHNIGPTQADRSSGFLNKSFGNAMWWPVSRK